MNSNLQDLYHLPAEALEADYYLLELVEQAGALEIRIQELIDQLSVEQGMILKAYMEIRDELELQSVKRALKFGKLTGSDC